MKMSERRTFICQTEGGLPKKNKFVKQSQRHFWLKNNFKRDKI